MERWSAMPSPRASFRLLLHILSLFLTVSSVAHAALPLLHPLFSDHAVLQRDSKVPVWGWADPGTRITVRFAGQEKIALAGDDGKWSTTLDPMAASSEGRTLTVSSQVPDQQSSITDVLVGDVWLCSGQSNMEMGVGLCNVPEEIAKADHPGIRLLTVPQRISYAPQQTLESSWLRCTPESLAKGGWGGFSAAAYFFGRDLQRELGVPIGLIHASWGGTICEAWASKEALAAFDFAKPDLARVEQVCASPDEDKIGAIMQEWYLANDPGTAKRWFLPETDASDWKTIRMPDKLAACGLPGYEGIVWTQHSFQAPASWVGKNLVMNLGPVSDVDTTWINGKLVGQTEHFNTPRCYKIPAGIVSEGKNVIAMRVLNAGGGGFQGTPDQMEIHPEGMESSAISLAGQWRIQDTATRASTGPALIGNPNIGSMLYNGMIAPLAPSSIKGAIWYQGEANANQPQRYRALLQAMVTDWRSRFGVGDFGFHIVSLANYGKPSPFPRDNDWAELREAQAMAAKSLSNCGIVMAIDIGEEGDIHPKNKREVGRRLALSALALSYGKPIEWSGPQYESMEISDREMRLRFSHAQGGLIAKGGELTGFAIAGEDGKFAWADARIEGETVIVSSPDVPKPAAVRYAWDSSPKCNLTNRDHLPAVPFRTDNRATNQ